MKILLVALLVGYSFAAAGDWDNCEDCVSQGYEWCSDACGETDCSGPSSYYYCTGSTEDSTCASAIYDLSYVWLWFTEYGEKEEAEPIVMTVSGGYYCMFDLWCNPTSVDAVDDETPTCTGVLDTLCSDCTAYWSAGTDNYVEPEMTEMMEGDEFEWTSTQYYAYIYVFNHGTTDGEASASGKNAQTMFMGMFALIATMLYLAF